MPDAAKMLYDDKKIEKELMDLKKLMRAVFTENDQLTLHIKKLEVAKRETDTLTDKEMESKRATTSTGFSTNMSRKQIQFRNEDIPDYEKHHKEKDTPMESLVKKLERNGYTVE